MLQAGNKMIFYLDSIYSNKYNSDLQIKLILINLIPP